MNAEIDHRRGAVAVKERDGFVGLVVDIVRAERQPVVRRRLQALYHAVFFNSVRRRAHILFIRREIRFGNIHLVKRLVALFFKYFFVRYKRGSDDENNINQ